MATSMGLPAYLQLMTLVTTGRHRLPEGAHRLAPYVCPLCARTSPNYFDIQHKYCSCCGSTDLPMQCVHRQVDGSETEAKRA